jgi:hypothetical protein
MKSGQPRVIGTKQDGPSADQTVRRWWSGAEPVSRLLLRSADLRRSATRWLNKGGQGEIPDDYDVESPLDDLEAARRIRSLCKVVSEQDFSTGSGNDAERRAARTAMKIAMKITDDLVRDSALGNIVDLCVRANELKSAEVLLRAIQTEIIRQGVLNDHPILRK